MSTDGLEVWMSVRAAGSYCTGTVTRLSSMEDPT